jgi:hypothetical protein
MPCIMLSDNTKTLLIGDIRSYKFEEYHFVKTDMLLVKRETSLFRHQQKKDFGEKRKKVHN